MSNGHIVNAYLVYCARCDEIVSFEGSPRMSVTKREFINMIRRDGWANTNRGWMCPKCRKRRKKESKHE